MRQPAGRSEYDVALAFDEAKLDAAKNCSAANWRHHLRKTDTATYVEAVARVGSSRRSPRGRRRCRRRRRAPCPPRRGNPRNRRMGRPRPRPGRKRRKPRRKRRPRAIPRRSETTDSTPRGGEDGSARARFVTCTSHAPRRDTLSARRRYRNRLATSPPRTPRARPLSPFAASRGASASAPASSRRGPGSSPTYVRLAMRYSAPELISARPPPARARRDGGVRPKRQAARRRSRARPPDPAIRRRGLRRRRRWSPSSESEARSTASASSATPAFAFAHASPRGTRTPGSDFPPPPVALGARRDPRRAPSSSSPSPPRGSRRCSKSSLTSPVPHDAVRERHLRLPRRDHGLEVVPAVHERGLLARHQHERPPPPGSWRASAGSAPGDDGVRRPTRARDQLAHARAIAVRYPATPSVPATMPMTRDSLARSMR